MAKIIWIEQALDDLANIADFSAQYSDNYASMIVSKLFNKVNILKTMPRVGRIVPEKNDGRIRELIEGNYRVILEESAFIPSITQLLSAVWEAVKLLSPG